MMGIHKDILTTSKAIYDGLVTDIHINNDKLILMNKDGEDTGNGIESTALSGLITKDIVGTDPDGTDDGITDLDQIPGIKDLDTLLN